MKKRYSLRRFSKELGCSKGVVRKKLFESGVSDFSFEVERNERLAKKVSKLIEQGDSYQRIADKLNFWKVKTRSGEGKWFGKTVRDICS